MYIIEHINKQYSRHCMMRTAMNGRLHHGRHPVLIRSSSLTFLPPQRGESERGVVRDEGFVYLGVKDQHNPLI